MNLGDTGDVVVGKRRPSWVSICPPLKYGRRYGRTLPAVLSVQHCTLLTSAYSPVAPSLSRSDRMGIANTRPQKIRSFSKSFTTTLTTLLIVFFAELGLKLSLMPVQTSSPSGVAVE